MRNIVRLPLLLILISSFVRCVQQRNDTHQIINVQENYTETISSSDIFEHLDYITLDETVLMRNITKIIPHGKFLYITDGVKLYKFRDDGAFLSIIGDKGRGRGEYVNINDFVVTNKVIYVLDHTKNILLYDTEQDTFIDKFELDFYAASLITLNDTELLVTSAYQNDVEHKFHVLNVNDYSVKSSFVEIDKNQTSYRHFRGQNNFQYNDGELLYNEPVNNNIYAIGNDNWSIKYSIDLWGKSPNKESLNKKYTSIVDLFIEFSERGYAYGLPLYVEGDNTLLFTLTYNSVYQMNKYDKTANISNQFSKIMLRDKNITVNIAELSFTPLSNGKVAFAVDENTGLDENRGTTVVIAKAF